MAATATQAEARGIVPIDMAVQACEHGTCGRHKLRRLTGYNNLSSSN